MNRRALLKSACAAALTPLLQSPLCAQPQPPQPPQMWGGPVLDTHLHLRKDPDSCYTHMQGCGVTNAVLLTASA